MHKLIMTMTVTVAATSLASCGQGAAAPAAPEAKAAPVALSTAAIDVVKGSKYGMISDSFDPCVYNKGGSGVSFRVPGRYTGIQAAAKKQLLLQFL